MNAYSDLTTLKSLSYLNIDVAAHDAYLRKLLEDASRRIDRWTERIFYCLDATRYFDGAGAKLILPFDLLSVTTLKTDEDGDGTFENTLATTDYHLYPLNDLPKVRIEINPNGSYGSFANGIQKGVEIAGVFGFGDGYSATPYISVGTLGVTVSDTTGTGVTMSTGHTVAAGHTIRIDSEQLYVLAVATNAVTVKRGVNGALAATHATSTTVSAYEYPMPITEACLITAMRSWKRKDSAYQDAVGNAETGQIITSKGIDPDVKDIIKMYRQARYL
jgi:hypothetical protein